jgi:transmembrane sensor
MNVQYQIERLIALQAAEWYENVKDGTGVNNAEFVHWLAESPRHVEALLSIAGEASLMRKVFESSAFDLNELLRNARPEVLALPLAPQHTPPNVQRRWWRRVKLRSVAAALAVLSLAAVPLYQWSSWQRFETPVGEQRTVQLKEGSVVNLNAFSRVDVRFDDTQRDIMLPRGEATFKVAKDPSRPFRVRTPGAAIEAVGTQFNVYARPDGTTIVAVLEGKVKVTSDRDGSASPVPLAAGGEVRVHANGRIEQEEHADIAEAVLWQQRKLIFKRTSLEDMAAEFNRYNKTTRIRLEGIRPETFRFSGAFDADDPQSLATLLMRESDLSVERNGEEIVIRGR